MGHTQLYNLVSGDGGYLFALEIDGAGFGLENTADGLQGRCFTGTVGPDEATISPSSTWKDRPFNAWIMP